MKGKVEVFAIASDGSETLVASEDNLVVDGAGESIVDMLSAPSSTLGINPRVMDTSNWRWGAISFGTAASSFSQNAYFYPPNQTWYNEDDCNRLLIFDSGIKSAEVVEPLIKTEGRLWIDTQPSTTGFPYVLGDFVYNAYGQPIAAQPLSNLESFSEADVTAGSSHSVGRMDFGDSNIRVDVADGEPIYKSGVSSLISQISTDHKLRVLWASSTIGAANGATASSYTPPYQLPSYPAPLNKKIEDASTAYAIASGDGTQSFGQFENRIEFSSTDGSSYFQGVYPPSDANALAGMLVSSLASDTSSYYAADFQTDPSANMVCFFSAGAGQYNVNGQMDYRGFVSATHNETTHVNLGNVYVSGVGGTESGVVVNKVSIFTLISAPDVWAMNMYGGIHQLGIWNVDCMESLKNNEAPFIQPGGKFRNDAGISKLEFKLFAKKTFTENLCKIRDNGSNAGFTNHLPLKIVWTIDFRSAFA